MLPRILLKRYKILRVSITSTDEINNTLRYRKYDAPNRATQPPSSLPSHSPITTPFLSALVLRSSSYPGPWLLYRKGPSSSPACQRAAPYALYRSAYASIPECRLNYGLYKSSDFNPTNRISVLRIDASLLYFYFSTHGDFIEFLNINFKKLQVCGITSLSHWRANFQHFGSIVCIKSSTSVSTV